MTEGSGRSNDPGRSDAAPDAGRSSDIAGSTPAASPRRSAACHPEPLPASSVIAIALALVAAAISVVALLGWIVGSDLLKSFWPRGHPSEVNAGLAGLVAAAATILRIRVLHQAARAAGTGAAHDISAHDASARDAGARDGAHAAAAQGARVANVLAAVLALTALAISLATLFEYVSGVDLRIDEFFFDAGVPVPGQPYPGRMAVPTAVVLALIAVGILTLGRRIAGFHPAQMLGFVAAMAGVLALLGYTYEVAELTSFGSATLVTLPIAFVLGLLGFAVVGADPRHGLVRQLVDPGLAGQVSRRILPAALIILPALGFLRYRAEQAALLSTNAGVVLMVVVSAAILIVISAFTASRLLDVEAERNAVRRDRDRFFELSNDLVLVTDLQGHMLELSPSWQTVLGVPIAEIKSHPFMEFVHPDDRLLTEAVFARQLNEDYQVAGFRNRYRRPDGTDRWLEWTARNDLPAERVYAIARDVTERVQSEELLRNASLYARGLIEASLDPLFTISPDGKITDVNQAAEEVVGRRRGDLIGSDFAASFTDQGAARAGYRRVLREGRVRDYALTVRDATGATTDVLFNATIYRDQRGELQGVFAAARDVTERNRAEAALSRLAAIVESSADTIYATDRDDVITTWNPAAERIFGYRADEVIGQHATITSPAESQPVQLEHASEAFAGRPQVFESMRLRKDGNLFRAEATIFPIRAADGSVTGLSTILRDVTEQYEAREKLREQAGLLELAHDAIIVRDFDGRIRFWNSGARRTYGWSAGEAIGKTTHNLLRTVFPESLDALTSALRATGEWEGQLRHTDRDGRVLVVESRQVVERNQSGDPVAVLEINRDVTEQHAAREKVREQAGLLELAHDAIFVRDFDGTIRYWNAGAERTYGWSADEAVGQVTHDLLKTVFPESRADLDSRLRHNGEWEGELTHTDREGNQIVVQSRMVLEQNKSGEPAGVLEINRDVTESVNAHRRLEQYADELRRSNEELEQFAYVASHDLQEPLRMVTGFVGLLQRRYGGQLTSEADEYIEFAVEGAHRMQGLINDLLAYSRVGTRGREPSPTDLSEVVDEVLVNLRAAVEESGAVVTCDDLPTVPADRHQMIQLFQNLVGNAIKFRAETRPEIRIGAQRDRRAWRVFVRDNGIGIAPEHQEQIFVIFRRLHSRDAYPGSGIGLAICKKIVERHRGRIWVESSAGEGATFWFTIPDEEWSGGGR